MKPSSFSGMIVILVVQLFLNLSVCSNKNDMPKYVFAGNASPKPELQKVGRVIFPMQLTVETVMGFGRGALLWLIGIPLPNSSAGAVHAPLGADRQVRN